MEKSEIKDFIGGFIYCLAVMMLGYIIIWLSAILK